MKNVCLPKRFVCSHQSRLGIYLLVMLGTLCCAFHLTYPRVMLFLPPRGIPYKNAGGACWKFLKDTLKGTRISFDGRG